MSNDARTIVKLCSKRIHGSDPDIIIVVVVYVEIVPSYPNRNGCHGEQKILAANQYTHSPRQRRLWIRRAHYIHIAPWLLSPFFGLNASDYLCACQFFLHSFFGASFSPTPVLWCFAYEKKCSLIAFTSDQRKKNNKCQ